MRPAKRDQSGQQDLLRSRLDQIVDLAHPLAKLGRSIDWSFLEERLGTVYADGCRAPLPTRLMAGLAALKHMHNLSDEMLCERWLENPYALRRRILLPQAAIQPFLDDPMASAHGGRETRRFVAREPASGHPQRRSQAGEHYDLWGLAHRRPRDASLPPCASRGDPTDRNALPGNPYDDHTLEKVIPAITKQIGASLTRVIADAGYRGHKAPKIKGLRVYTSGQKRGVTDQIKRELRRRPAVEPVIGHLKEEHRMGRNYLAGQAGDATNVVLAAVGYNFRLLLVWLAELWCALLLIDLIDDQPSAQTVYATKK